MVWVRYTFATKSHLNKILQQMSLMIWKCQSFCVGGAGNLLVIISWEAVWIHLSCATEFKVIILTGDHINAQRDTYCSQLHLIGLHSLVYSRRQTETLCNSHFHTQNWWGQGIPLDSLQLEPTGHLNQYCNWIKGCSSLFV